jgi:thioester reductase-like protein
MMQPSILITGASGEIGRALVPYLLRESDANLVLLLHRRGVETARAYLPGEAFGVADCAWNDRVRFVAGDVAKPGLALTDPVRKHLQNVTTHVIHSAALTRFDRPLAEVRRVNLDGTRHVVSLAQDCSKLERFAFVSTAFVSGCRVGNILENELDHADGFVNTYEQSKYEAELFIRSMRSTLPIAVYRLSSVVGDSRSGVVNHFSAPHHAMRMMYMGLASMMPGTPDYPVDLIPGDVAARAICELFVRRFRPDQVFHITAGREKSFTLSEVIDDIYRHFSELDEDWARRRYPKPALAPTRTFDLFLRSVEDANNVFLKSVLRTIRHFAQQLNYPKAFDRSELLACYPELEDLMPDIRAYFGKVVRFCLQSDWGQHVA